MPTKVHLVKAMVFPAEIRLIIFFAAKMEKLYTVRKNKTGS